jgi:16S rRNA (cytidine1402-2'-O)-methyltransferase
MGTLYVVATPIGNLEDVTLRALRVLREADLILAEDTRHSAVLLRHHGIAARPRSLHAYNEAARLGEALAVLEAGGSVALVSDAGTPLVSDPGERLVAAAAQAGHEVVAVPGASAPLAALVVSGLPSAAFHFVGFLPRRAGERAALLARLAELQATLILFESPRRTGATLGELAAAFGERRACVARELTKLHEEAARGSLVELAARFAGEVRGEVTIVVEGRPAQRAPTAAADLDDARIRALLAEGLGVRGVADALVPEGGARRRAVYARALALRREGDGV